MTTRDMERRLARIETALATLSPTPERLDPSRLNARGLAELARLTDDDDDEVDDLAAALSRMSDDDLVTLSGLMAAMTDPPETGHGSLEKAAGTCSSGLCADRRLAAQLRDGVDSCSKRRSNWFKQT